VSEEKRLDRKEDDRLLGIPAVAFLPVLLGGAFYFGYLYLTNIIDFNQWVLYASLLVIPAYLCLCFGAYELLFSLKVKKPLVFHLKRFLSRMTIILGLLLGFFGLWSVLMFLSPIISLKYILLLAAFMASLVLALLVAIPKTRQLIKRFTSGE
jgi:hypothetical protein